ncbi:unnamed protein product, partial [Musa acuminata subsp. burmannicoides]
SQLNSGLLWITAAMVKSPNRDETGGVKKGPWTPEEDRKLVEYVEKHGRGSWQRIPKIAGLNRCGKSCRLRWTNYLRPDIRRGKFTEEEEQLIIHLHSMLGNKWSSIATKLPGRTDNEIKNYWNTHLRKKLIRMGIDPVTHRPATNLNLLTGLSNLLSAGGLGGTSSHLDNALKLQADVAHLLKLQLVQSLIQVLTSSYGTPNMDLMNLFRSPPLGNYQPSDLLQLSRQIEGGLGGSLSLQNSIPMIPNLSILSHYLNNIGLQPTPERSFPSDAAAVTASDASRTEEPSAEISNVSSTSSIPASSSTHPLVSASSETKNIDLVQSSDTLYTNTLASESFETCWDNLMKSDNLDSHFGWKDIIDQMSWPDAP